MTEPSGGMGLIGPVRIERIAHGGHWVARHEGRVIFVRHALEGEQVMLQITDRSSAKFWRADAIEVLEPSSDRVPPGCPIARPGGCGGCDFQHVDLGAQRGLKAAVITEQLERLAKLDPSKINWSGEVEALPELTDRPGLGWRTRMRYHVDDHGRAGLRTHHSHQVVPLPAQGCAIADPVLPDVVDHEWPPGAELNAVHSASGTALLVDGVRQEGGGDVITEHAAGREWSLDTLGFWQVHPAAADTLVEAVLAGLDPRPGERAFDLYCGVGLFAGALADAGCQVWGVEANAAAIHHARANLRDVGRAARFTAGRVDRSLTRPAKHGGLPAKVDLVVLDPPRTGAGKVVMEQVAARRPRAVAYVACDPAALARDLATAGKLGYEVVQLRAFDLFPMTHHMECVVILRQGRDAGA